jgi:hypothetical protein
MRDETVYHLQTFQETLSAIQSAGTGIHSSSACRFVALH